MAHLHSSSHSVDAVVGGFGWEPLERLLNNLIFLTNKIVASIISESANLCRKKPAIALTFSSSPLLHVLHREHTWETYNKPIFRYPERSLYFSCRAAPVFVCQTLCNKFLTGENVEYARTSIVTYDCGGTSSEYWGGMQNSQFAPLERARCYWSISGLACATSCFHVQCGCAMDVPAAPLPHKTNLQMCEYKCKYSPPLDK